MTGDLERFIGTWRLVEITDASPAILSRVGERPFGQLIYAADGYMAGSTQQPGPAVLHRNRTRPANSWR